MKYCVQRLFIENMTALIKMWHFLEGISSPSAVKKVKQKLVSYTYQDVMFFRRRFAALMEKKATQEPLPDMGENINAQSCLHGKLTDRGYMQNVNKLC